MIPDEMLTLGQTQFPVLGQIADGHSRLVTEHGVSVNAAAGDVLFDVGDEVPGLGLVVSGCVRVSSRSETGRELVLYRVRPGETCTITAGCLVSDSRYPARGTLEEDLSALVLPRTLFRTLLHDSDPFREFVFGIFTSRLGHLMELVSEVAFHKLDVRLARRLLDLGPVIEKSHQELADEVGSTREMVSRILESFADQGMVALGRRRIEILDVDAVRRDLLDR